MLQFNSTYSPKICIFAFISLVAYLTTGCALKDEIHLDYVRSNSDTQVLCGNHPNVVELSDFSSWSVIVRVDKSQDNTHTVSIKISDRDKISWKTIGENLKEGESFRLKNTQWNIVKIGSNGVKVNGQDWCDRKFVYIKQLH
jgi:hypothetical protein